MPAVATAPLPTAPASPDQPSRIGRLLNLVRRLIDHGKELARTLQLGRATSDHTAVTHAFGTNDIGHILALITRGLHRAAALEARLLRSAARPDVDRRPAVAQCPRKPGAARPAKSAAVETDCRLALLPTPEQIAAEVRRRPIGAVIADICRDLGILPNHPLWQELQLAIIVHDGSLASLVKDICDRVLRPLGTTCSASIAGVPASAPALVPGTGPP